MKKFAIFRVAVVLVVCAAFTQPPEPAPAAAKSARDHGWLKQMVGEWHVKFAINMGPDQPPMEAEGTDSVRALGESWIIAEMKTTMMGAPYNGILSLGYNAQKEQFHGTWIDSFGGYLWVYKGTLNDAGDTLTLETSGPSPMDSETMVQYREVIQIIGEDSRSFESSFESEEGTWTRLVTIEYHRKK